MKKIILSALLASLLISVSSAQVLIGSRQAGMGGTGVASSVGLNAVAFNPAGLMKGPKGEFLMSLGAASHGLNQISESFSSATDPAQFMMDNYSTNLDASGSLYGIIGFNFNNVGVSLLIPSIGANLSKPADTLSGSVTALATSSLVLTLGHTFSTPFLPFATVDVGTNIKAITTAYGGLTIGGDPTVGNPVVATQEVAQASGTGFDVGAKATVDIPMLADFSVGIALRNLAQSIKYKPDTREDVYSVTPPATDPEITKGTVIEGTEVTANYPTSTAIGCAGTIAAIGLKVAGDITTTSGGTGILDSGSDTVTSIGLEYPMLMRTLILRGGVASGQNVSITTLGAKINIPFLTLELANIIDNKNSKNTSYVIDAGVAF